MGRTFRDRGHVVGVVFLYLLSRAILSFFVDGFEAHTLNYYWQFADPKLLREDLLRTVFYLHSQPPLFNFGIGIVLKLFPVSFVPAVRLIYMALGLIFDLSLYGLLRRLQVGKTAALLLAALFMISPAVVLQENLLFYEYPAASLLCATTYFFCEFAASRKPSIALVTASLASLLVLAINGFHWLWAVLIAAAMVVLGGRNWMRTAKATAGPVGIVLAVHLKNLVVFGTFGLSSYFVAMNLSLISVDHLPPALRSELERRGQLSAVSTISPYAETNDYLQLRHPTLTGVPVLDMPYKSTGAVNRNHRVFLDISEPLRRDALFALRNYPQYYTPHLKDNLVRWLLNSADNAWGVPHFPALDQYVRWFDLIAFGPPQSPVLLTCGLVLGMLYGLWVAWRGLRGKQAPAYAAACGLMVANVVGLNAGMILVAAIDHQRYRFRTDALSFVLFIVAIRSLYRLTQRRRRSHAYDMVLNALNHAALPKSEVVSRSLAAAVEELLDLASPTVSVPEAPSEGARARTTSLAHAALLPDVGRWLATNGEAIYGTKPWTTPWTVAADGSRVRLTASDQSLYLIVINDLLSAEMAINDVILPPDATVILLGYASGPLLASQEVGRLRIQLPDHIPGGHPLVFRITPKPEV
ncbi:MAG: hypothetical protein WCG85_27720 [Polyangia bacterium]